MSNPNFQPTQGPSEEGDMAGESICGAEDRPKTGIVRLKAAIFNACTALDKGRVGDANNILRKALKND